MLTLNPTESFPIVRVLEDHTDTSTNYVQAVIRDATTDALIDTVSLTDKGNRRFSKVWKVTYDNAFGQGRFIVITTTVYTDSSYTEKNPNYAEKAETYLIQTRWSPTLAGAGSGGIDYREIAKVVAEVLDRKKLPEIAAKLETPTVFPTEEILKGVEKIVGKIPEPIETDLSLVEKGLSGVVKAVESIPKPKDIDFSPIIKELKNLNSKIQDVIYENRITKNEIIKSFDTEKIINNISSEILTQIQEGKIKFSLFSDGTEITNTKEKRNTYLQMLAKKYQ